MVSEPVLSARKEKPQVLGGKRIKLKACCAELVPTKGMWELHVWANNELDKIRFAMVPRERAPIGLEACHALGPIKREHLLEGQGPSTTEAELEDGIQGSSPQSTDSEE